ncbi:hypothetical protein DFR70_12483 [Nocardia tenerifensis]|uniref:Uncharacterized protein n=1 Tax=Nocardia tenerifensis TaxID=228006 RepID=A0A318JSZ4_9NOCA|nr:hypothetical protein [Nocardia tenerifensis]PXX54642.1 hypothetical protein DFR70_12483 [Nocardia tenerifensis]
MLTPLVMLRHLRCCTDPDAAPVAMLTLTTAAALTLILTSLVMLRRSQCLRRPSTADRRPSTADRRDRDAASTAMPAPVAVPR